MGCSSPSSSSAIYYWHGWHALIVILSLFWCVHGGEVRSDGSVLLQVKRFLQDPSGQLDSWNEDIHFCRWFGIACNANSRVTGLRVPAINGTVYIAGRLTPAISSLTELRCLSLPFNRLTGAIPDQLWEMENIEVLHLGGNLLAGTLPTSFRGLRRLRVLDLGSNGIHGEVPPSVANCSFLQILNMSFNQISGRLPREIGYSCSELEHVDFSGNFLFGAIPASFGNCTRLRSLLLRSNLLGDVIPASLGFLRSLEILDVSKNSLSGSIPPQIGNCSQLTVLVLSNPNIRRRNFSQEDYNYFEGNIPPEIWSLPMLRLLWSPRASLEGTLPANVTGCGSLEVVNLEQNFFSGEIPAWLSRCARLRFLDLSLNLLTGKLRSDIRVPCMRFFDVSGNRFYGNIPRFTSARCEFWPSAPSPAPESYVSFFSGLLYESRLSGGVLVIHRFSRNHFRGLIDSLPISYDLRRKKTTYVFVAGRNAIGETFPVNLFADCDGLDALFVDLSRNRITGVIPARIGCGSLRALDLSGNRISGSIDESVSSLFFLVSLNISWNDLRGRIPESVGEMKRLRYLSLAGNQLTGSIPPALGEMRSLQVLELSSNALSGEIPNAMLNLSNLTALLLDNNKLTGQIPNFAQVKTLSTFNASFNNLSGPLPANGDIVKCNSLVGNPLLHGSCHSPSSAVPVMYETPASSADLTVSPHTGGGLNSIEIASIASSSAVLLVLVTLIGVLLYARKWKPRFHNPRRPARKEVTVFTDIGVPLTFESVVQATASFSASNCIGNGGFGATYKAEISPGVLMAVKRLAIGRFQGVQQFHAEIKTLGRLRHRNLVTLIGYHASETEMFLVYNYLAGGNLEKFIQERSSGTIDWRILQKIALDVACALAYLHDQCVPRVVHRDVKPSNILLDDDYNAYLSDFGLARLLGTSETHATTGVAGTFGYVAPEYAMTCRVSDKADVYSYGVVLLELLSDKKALDPSFSSYGNGFNIVGWASMLVQEERAGEFFTPGLWVAGARDQLVEMLELAVTCTLDSLPARPTMRQVVRRLKNLHSPHVMS